ncbi:phosphoserine phosphatase SerB [Shewanella inventionis]|uniref:Phosphoserine phosphatase n=1 Tax=Shewanella inventionis TaxID=1738770 RepID=A0ABQ1IZ82_9GAMM|nr:phosphoserine phosphatase SerB [Shewanella inventionis]MCL1157325.1 phosphoserine phosphatase SerB [Shewanella inventionis]UAL45318.1 phosphoserine phosphatase SerB [Shewanella inventionis]GGB55674.1 phosphoserine phosphatase SerB [Shewanella inventionis]
MQQQGENVLLNWLFSEACETYQHQGRVLYRYEEPEYPISLQSDLPYRCRVIFSSHCSADIEAWLCSISINMHIAQLKRQNDLLGFELSAQVAIDEWIAAFPQNIAAEIVLIQQPLARLNHPGLLVMDMDSTAIQIECIDELAAMAGVGDEVAAVTASAMRGELDFEQSLRQRVAKLAGADAAIIKQLCDGLPLMPGIESMVAELKAHQWKLVVASGGFIPFVEHLKHLLGLDAAYANELVVINGKLTGEVTGEVVDAQYKANVIERSALQWGIASGQRVAIGDGANDIPMIQAADLGLAFHAKPKLVAAADAAIDRLDLRALVFCLQA